MARFTQIEKYYLERLKEEIVFQLKAVRNASLKMESDLGDIEIETGVSFTTLKRLFGFDNSRPNWSPGPETRDKLVKYVMRQNCGWEGFIKWVDEQNKIPNESSAAETETITEHFFPISIENAIVEVLPGEIKFEIDILPESKYRTATLIYRGKGINFQRPQASGEWIADNSADQNKFECFVPEPLPENTLTEFAMLTCRLVKKTYATNETYVGKVVYRFTIWDIGNHSDSEHLDLFLSGDSPKIRSSKLHVKVSQLR